MERTATSLIAASLTPASHRCYQNYLSQFQLFARHYNFPIFPTSPRAVVAFAAYLYEKGYAPSTIASHFSAISYYHKLSGLIDPADSFIVRKLLQGARKLSPAADSRLPITKDILIRLIDSVTFVTHLPYHQALLAAMFSLAFYAFLRVGEITGSTSNVLLFNQITITSNVIYIRFTHFKHHCGTPVTIIVNPASKPCPVALLHRYLTLRGSSPGPLFILPGQNYLSRRYFTSMLHVALTYLGLNTALYKSHSFRIGAATHAALLGLSDPEIQALGRWKSGAFKKYIRIPTVSF